MTVGEILKADEVKIFGIIFRSKWLIIPLAAIANLLAGLGLVIMIIYMILAIPVLLLIFVSTCLYIWRPKGTKEGCEDCEDDKKLEEEIKDTIGKIKDKVVEFRESGRRRTKAKPTLDELIKVNKK